MASSATLAPDTRVNRVSAFLKTAGQPDQLFHALVFVAAASIVAITLVLVFESWIHSAPSRVKFGLGFLLTETWDPNAGQFGALPFVFGTVVTSLLSLIIAVPLEVGAATFLAELAPPLISDGLTFCIELLAACPASFSV